MKIYILSLAAFLLAPSSTLIADTEKSPAGFQSGDFHAQYIDITGASYEIVIDAETKSAKAKSRIDFDLPAEGNPLFDLVPEPNQVQINGTEVATRVIRDADSESRMRVVTTKFPAGSYTLEVEHEIKAGLIADRYGVGLGFWFSDLDDRNFLEQFLPANLEYDQYGFQLHLRVNNSKSKFTLMTNGEVSSPEENTWEIVFPSYFNVSSMFLHLRESEYFRVAKHSFESIDGRQIPVTIYKRRLDWRANLNRYWERTEETLKELESDYGAFPHEQVLIYANESFPGGMEHHGATITNLWALAHEITHFYFGRGIMPMNGDSGWIDEALASWRDDSYPVSSQPNYRSANMASHSSYRRTTDTKAYTQGASFMSFVDSRLRAGGDSLKAFLNELLESHTFETINTNLFQNRLEDFSGQDFEAEFVRYVHGGLNRNEAHVETEQLHRDKQTEENPYHPQLSRELIQVLN